MTVISDTSPIVNLAAIGHVHLLRDLFGAVLIPPAVYDEIVVRGAGRPGARETAEAGWIQKCAVADDALVRLIEREVHRGEAEALALAIELRADWLLLDERAARELAETAGLRYTGLLGILATAKARGFVSSVRPLLDALRTDAGFWFTDALYRHVLDAAGEAP